jgi:hypothetical protein
MTVNLNLANRVPTRGGRETKILKVASIAIFSWYNIYVTRYYAS